MGNNDIEEEQEKKIQRTNERTQKKNHKIFCFSLAMVMFCQI